MLKTGAFILSVWCCLNVLPGMGSLLFITMGKHAPGLKMLFDPGEIGGIENRALATIDGLATLLNALIAIYCITFYFVVRKSLLKEQPWALWVLGCGAFAL